MELRWSNFKNFLEDRAQAFGPRVAFSFFQSSWQTLTYAQVREEAEKGAHSLTEAGFRAGDRIALLSATSLDLTVEILGIFLLGAVAVPLDSKLGREELLVILRHVDAKGLLASEEFFSMASELKFSAEVPKLLHLGKRDSLGLNPPGRLSEPDPKTTAAIFYTSGTLSSSKGVMVSGHSLLAELTMLTSFRDNTEQDVMYSILPLNHLYGLTAGVLYSMACGSEYVIAHSLAPADIAFCLRERKVTQMNVVPLLLNLLKRGILKKLEEQTPWKRSLARGMLKVAPYLPLSIRRRLFASLHEKLGGHVRRAVSGAAPLDPSTFDFFHAIGAPVYEGYGLTETGPVISVNTLRHSKKGSVGRPLPGVEIRIDQPDESGAGEILTRGPHLMQGYFREMKLTSDAISEGGWFRTGDRGVMEGGYLRLTGRLKSLIVLPSGKKVQAEEVEQALGHSIHFQDCCVLGAPGPGSTEQLVAIVYPTEEFLLRSDLQSAAEKEVAKACESLAHFKHPARVVVRSTPFAKTSSGKVKRHKAREEL
jgi:long-chain acyl-CoA synthetase